MQQVADGKLTLAGAKQQLAASLKGYHTQVNDRLVDAIARQMNEIGALKRQSGLVRALEEVARFLDGSFRTQIRVLEREKEERVCAQDFDAAAAIRDEQRELEAYWSREAVLRRVLYALGRT
jgi:excinuclease UvrABC nuclease subunit